MQSSDELIPLTHLRFNLILQLETTEMSGFRSRSRQPVSSFED